MEYKNSEKVSKSWLIYVLILFLSVSATLFLRFWRGDLFTVQATLPATLTYFGLFALLFRLPALTAKRQKVRSRTEEKSFDAQQGSEELGESEGRLDGILAEIGLFLLLATLSTAIGGLAGFVWWGAGGHELRTFLEALRIGAILGALVVALLFVGV